MINSAMFTSVDISNGLGEHIQNDHKHYDFTYLFRVLFGC